MIKEPAKDVKIHFDKLWLWVLDTVYDTATSKYEWGNFKKQAFTIDGGVDF